MGLSKSIFKSSGSGKISMRMKLFASMLSVVAILLVSCIISYMEYTRMSGYVSDLVENDIDGIHNVAALSSMLDSYNLEVFSVVGDELSSKAPDFDEELFLARCDSIRSELRSQESVNLVDSVLYAYSAYMLTSLELDNVLMYDFISSKSWYFERLDPRYERFRSSIESLSAAMTDILQKDADTFERGFYRSFIPVFVAVCVVMLLVIMLLFFILSGYVNPIYRMLSSLQAYRSYDKKYTYRMDGDDQLSALNDNIAELTNENVQLRRRISNLRNRE